MMYEKYESPLSSRYASEEMLHLFSQEKRIRVWRKLWTALARAEHDLGLPITAEQVAELEAHIDDIDFECAAQREKEVRHDVMAHVYAYGKAAPGAAGVIHLGATSCYVTDNGDLILYRDGLRYLRGELLGVLKILPPSQKNTSRCPPSDIPTISLLNLSLWGNGQPSGCRIFSPIWRNWIMCWRI